MTGRVTASALGLLPLPEKAGRGGKEGNKYSKSVLDNGNERVVSTSKS